MASECQNIWRQNLWPGQNQKWRTLKQHVWAERAITPFPHWPWHQESKKHYQENGQEKDLDLKQTGKGIDAGSYSTCRSNHLRISSTADPAHPRDALHTICFSNSISRTDGPDSIWETPLKQDDTEKVKWVQSILTSTTFYCTALANSCIQANIKNWATTSF